MRERVKKKKYVYENSQMVHDSTEIFKWHTVYGCVDLELTLHIE